MPRTGLAPEELKRRAVEVANQRIKTVGYSKLRVTDVAAELGVSHAALYAHFSGKAEILDAVVGHWLDMAQEELRAAVSGPGTPEQRLENWLIQRLRLKRQAALKDPELYEAYCQATDRLREVVLRHKALWRDQIAMLLTQAIPDLKDPAHAARLVQSAMYGFNHPRLVLEYLDTEAEMIEDRLRDVLHTLIAGLRSIS
ncbi:TetR/AcrR family transcriptional regulator [Alloyangia pacifica]|uniref:Transcriptional regulator, TetR family n=1 Tax=Alloyangia pacifica TaxID=311180 RepID=A0A1I6RTK5_9RHOB|nr:TetR/AcrR family transcriptional regulator [Alloyangia pacifica]SDG59628.1 transcriptional regulator, TetR family [Alloyangia pacifica]SFS67920.1 transcriptional regulator, TetR family [Alloyangia pacifica]